MEKPAILYVDDEKINLDLFEANLERKYRVFVADSGIKGLKIIEIQRDICVVISDMKMPDMNGLEFVTSAKAKFPKINFYILTGYDITNEIRKALNDGIIVKYFQKPFNMHDIDKEIKRVIDL